MVIPDCSYPLLGRDLLTKIGAQIHFSLEGVSVMDPTSRPVQVLTMQIEDEYRLHQGSPEVAPKTDMQQWLNEYPQAWAETRGPGLAKHRPPIYTELKPGAEAVRVKRYQMPQEAQRGTFTLTYAGCWLRASYAHANPTGIPPPPSQKAGVQ